MSKSGSQMGWKKRSGGILSGLLLVAVAMIVLVVVGVVLVARNVRVHSTSRDNGDDVSIDTPAGRISIHGHEKLNPSALGVPVYPGAERRKDGGGATFEWTSADGKQERDMAVSGASLFTPDSPSQVLSWYREQLPSWMIVTDEDHHTRFEFKKGGHKRFIDIHAKDGGTEIGVASVGDAASN